MSSSKEYNRDYLRNKHRWPQKSPEENCAGAKRWREDNPERYKATQAAALKGRQLRNREWILSYLVEHPCVDCGERDPIVLHFDHRDGDDKLKSISELVKKGRSLNAIENEVRKCDVRCANCHTKRTAKQFSWWKCEEKET